MRLLYLDESGFSNPVHEPFAVVAGVLLHGDRDVKRLEERLDRYARKLLPERQERVIFHAKDIFHGSPPWVRDRFDREARWEIITALCTLPREYHFGAFMGYVDRNEFEGRFGHQYPDQSNKERETTMYCVAAGQCIVAADTYLINTESPRENAVVIAEDRQYVRKHMRELQAFMQSPGSGERLRNEGLPNPQALQFPLKRIIDTVHFAEKRQSSMLQLADVVSFAIKRRLMGKADGEVFCKPLYEQMAVYPKEWARYVDP